MAQTLEPQDIEVLFSELREIKDPRLRDAVAEIWCEIAAEMKRALLAGDDAALKKWASKFFGLPEETLP